MGIYWPNVIGVLVWALCSYAYYLVSIYVNDTPEPQARPPPMQGYGEEQREMDSAMETAMYLEYD